MWKKFFQLLSTKKVILVTKIMQSAYLCLSFHVKYKKVPFLAALTWFLILGKIQDGGRDGDHRWWRHRPPAPPSIKFISSFWEDPRPSADGKMVSKYCSISKTLGRGSIHLFAFIANLFLSCLWLPSKNVASEYKGGRVQM